MAMVNISLVIYSRLSNSARVIRYIDPVCHQSGMWPLSAVGDPKTGEGVPETADGHSHINQRLTEITFNI